MRRPDLVADCGSCAALCCVATSFDASEDFALAKRAGERCLHLRDDDRCAIHAEHAHQGFSGCAVYDCYGAGPRATRAFADSRASEREHERNDAFMSLRPVHELLWQLTEAAKLCPLSRPDVAAQLAHEVEALDALARGPLQALSELDLRPRQAAARAALLQLGHALGGRRGAARALLVIQR